MKLGFLVAAIAAPLALAAAPASAAIMFSFEGGLATPGAGFTVINAFNTDAGITGNDFEIKTPPADTEGAPPANSFPAGTPYLSVLGGGSASLDFGVSVTAFQFDWGSIDRFNTLSIRSTGADPIIVPGSNFTNPANGNQVAPGTNGRFTVWSTEGETFTGVTFASGTNSFEVDNLAIGAAVPEPATWAMMIFGFAGVGATIRQRRTLRARTA